MYGAKIILQMSARSERLHATPLQHATIAILVLAVAAATAVPAAAQSPDTDIYMADLLRTDGGLRLGEPINITGRAGYDNQPHFVYDTHTIWYTRIDDSGQADIWRFRDGTHTNVTATAPESEYSATPLPDGSGMSVIRVERDSTQRLWRFDADGGSARVVFEAVAPVGYHAWADADRVAMFVLGQPATLQLGDVRTGAARMIASSIGRSIQKVPDRVAISFMHTPPNADAMLRMLDIDSGTITDIAAPPRFAAPGATLRDSRPAEYHAWLPDGTLISAAGSALYAWSAPRGEWRVIANLEAAGIVVSRLAVSADGARIAFVGERR